VAAYVAFIIDIHDAARFSAYARAAAPTYDNHGGRIILRGPIVSVLEGSLDLGDDSRLVVIEFPSAPDARAWWESEGYQATITLRKHPVSGGRAFLVEGIDLKQANPS
jgi:uncharacterized protein (DUF1330 family)